MADDGGLARFQARMREVRAAARLSIKPALMQSANEVVDAMEMLAPEGESGDLKNSIRVVDTGHDLVVGVVAGGEATTRVYKGGRYDYALANEYGTQEMDAQPFFWPGYRSVRRRANARVKRAIAKAIKDVWGR